MKTMKYRIYDIMAKSTFKVKVVGKRKFKIRLEIAKVFLWLASKVIGCRKIDIDIEYE